MLILVILIVVFQQLVQQQHVSCFHLKQGIGQEGKKICVLHELGNKTQLGGGVWAHCEPLSGFSEGAWGKAFEKLTIFNLKLV